MKINEVEERLQISKANIRFYEKEGLLSPERAENGYRSYSEQDIEQLKKIIILRKLDMSIPDIKEIFAGKITMQEALEKTRQHLEEELAKLNGSLELTKTLQETEQTFETFDAEYYWNFMQEEEKKGFSFADIVYDYVEFEKQSLINMFEFNFLFPLGDIVSSKGWKVAFWIILGVCVLRGIVTAVIRDGGTFLEGFSYPFIIFLCGNAVMFPIFLAEYRYQYEPEPEIKKSPAWLTMLKVIGAIAYLPVVGIGGLLIIEDLFYSKLIEGEFWITGNWLWWLYFYVVIYLIAVLVWMYSRHASAEDDMEVKSLICRMPKKAKKKFLIFSVLVYLVGWFCFMMCYDVYTDTGVKHRIFWYQKEYEWEDVDHFSLYAEPMGDTLSYKLVMKDGYVSDYMNSSIMFDNLPKEQFPNGYEDYYIWLTRTLVELGIPLEDTDWEKLNKDLGEKFSQEQAKKIRDVVEGK